MVSSAPRVSPGLGGPARPYHISCLVGPKLKSSMVFSRLAERARDTTIPSFTRPNACLAFSGVTRLRVPRSSSLPQRPQLDSDCSIATTCSKVMRWAGSWVEGCGVIGVAAGAGAALCSWADAMPIGHASNANPASATEPAVNVLNLVHCAFMVFLQLVGWAKARRRAAQLAQTLVRLCPRRPTSPLDRVGKVARG